MDRSEIVVREKFREHLADLEGTAHLWVLTWFDRAERDRLRVHPRGDRNKPLRHVFALRSPARPNPIGLTLVDLESVDQATGVLVVRGLDALDGSVVLDLKPYLPAVDRP